jgi:hypothetical protein
MSRIASVFAALALAGAPALAQDATEMGKPAAAGAKQAGEAGGQAYEADETVWEEEEEDLPEIPENTQRFETGGAAALGDGTAPSGGQPTEATEEVREMLEETEREEGLVEVPEAGAEPTESWFGCKPGMQGEPCEEAGTMEARGATDKEEGED